MNSFFISGTDTDVGKTVITSGLARIISDVGVDIGVMKPFAAGELQNSSFQSEDTELLAKSARVDDPESLINPQFFPIPASPFTAQQNLGTKPDLNIVMDSFLKLQKMHQMILVEGMGGVMTPILQDYFVADLIKDMKLQTLVVTRSRIGTINHTIMTIDSCKNRKIDVSGIIINNFDSEGYVGDELKRDLESLTGVPVLGIVPKIQNLDVKNVADILTQNLHLDVLNLP